VKHSSSRRARPLARLLGQLASRLVFWAPVWLPLVFVYQLVLGGLRPTLQEGERVRGAEAEVRARVDALEAERADLETRRAMLSDPIYRARVERTRDRADRRPLTLDEATALRRGPGEPAATPRD